MTSEDDIEALAGEYVLGTLDAAERTAVAARRQREPLLDNAIIAWEARLAPLDQLTVDVPPPPDLLARIEQTIASGGQGGADTIDLAAIQQRLRTWRRRAIAASSIAASLLVYVGLRETVLQDEPQNYVAVFAQDDVLPRFYMTINLKTRELTVRPVGAERQPGKTYQLWIASDQLGPAPQSLGLVDEALAPTQKSLTRFDPALLQRATFGVSLEPAGGSPTGRPTSPALHAKLLPVAAP